MLFSQIHFNNFCAIFVSQYSEKMTKMDPDHITGLVSEVVPDKSCLIFCASKKNCENLATLLSKLLPKKYVDHKLNERDNLIKAIENDMGSKICPILAKTIPCGIAYHHSGLTADERRHLEESFRLGILCIICCTSTLAAGVNLPAKRVIIRSPYVGSSFITLSRYKQVIWKDSLKLELENKRENIFFRWLVVLAELALVKTAKAF